jgi:trimethylamine monooxygenase
MKKRVCIVGAGPSGLAALHFLHPHSKEAKLEVVCYDKQSQPGGLWKYSWRVGVDEYGEPQHRSMYQNLVSNGPKECLEFADYTFDEHFGKPIISFPKRSELEDYILGRMRNGGSNLLDVIQCSTIVRKIDRKEHGYTVTVEDLPTCQVASSFFDAVIVATGHFSSPNLIQIPGIETFPGRVLHAHDFRSAREFQNKNVLVIGSSYSAEDIGLQIMKYGGKSVIVSYRTRPMGFHFPLGMEERPLSVSIQQQNVEFLDGSTAQDLDAIVLCTGYKHTFPFLDPPLRLETPNVLYPDNLYKGCTHGGTDNLFYIGMQDQFYTFSMFDLQALTIRDFLLDTLEVPSEQARQATISLWKTRQESLSNEAEMIRFQADYMKDELGQPEREDYRFDLQSTVDMFLEWEHHKLENILTYHDKTFRSPVTGTMGAVPSAPWWTNTK